jgi:hypothetical protein
MRFLFILILLLWSCTGATDKAGNSTDSLQNSKADTTHTAELDYDSYLVLDNYFPSSEVDTSKLQTFNSDCAILVYPTKEQIEEMKKEEGEDNFYTGADDSNWYQGQAIQLMDSLGIKQTTATKQFIKLVGDQKTWTLDIRKKNMPAWNLVFFKKTKTPLIIPAIGLTTEQIQAYFETKQ